MRTCYEKMADYFRPKNPSEVYNIELASRLRLEIAASKVCKDFFDILFPFDKMEKIYNLRSNICSECAYEDSCGKKPVGLRKLYNAS